MKTRFVNTLIKSLVEKKEFVPLEDSQGNLYTEKAVNVMIKEAFGSLVVLELVDGDKFSVEEITVRLQENNKRLFGLKAGTNYYYFEVFMFDKKPDEDKLNAIVSGQTNQVMKGKLLKCITIELSEGKTNKHFKVPLTDFGIMKTINDVISKGYEEEIDINDISLLLQQKNEELKLEMKAKVPILTYILIGINILVGALILLYSMYSGISYGELLLDVGAKMNSRILTGEYWRFITPVFLHADIMHLAINCYSLYVIGINVEKIFGRLRFFGVYFIAGIFGNLLSFMFSQSPGVGASGAIFGLMGALLYFWLEKPALFKAYFGYNVLMTIVVNLIYGFTNPRIDNYAHIGGLVGGFLASGMVSRPLKTNWYFNKYLYFILSVSIAAAGLYYGFSNKQNRILVMVNELEQLEKSAEWVKAEKLAEEILNLKPDDSELVATVMWTVILAESTNQKPEEAIGHAKELIPVDPQNGHYILGLLYFDRMEYELSKEELLKVKELVGSDEKIDQLLNEIETLINQ